MHHTHEIDRFWPDGPAPSSNLCTSRTIPTVSARGVAPGHREWSWDAHRTGETSRLTGRSVADAGRVIAGTARSIRLEAPGEGTRPLGDRVKQTLFAILDPDLRGAIVLDLFAGSGAAGIEALSRGAAHATFVERDATAVKVIKANLERTSLADRATVTKGDVLGWLRDPARARRPPPPSSSSIRPTRTRRP